MIKRLITIVISPLSVDPDGAREEFILNVLLLACIGLSLLALFINIAMWVTHTANPMPLAAYFIIFSFFIFLYFLSRKGLFRWSAYCLLITLFSLITFQVYAWGTDLPSALLSYVLIIVMAGVLINSRIAFVVTLIVSAVLSLITYYQVSGVIKFQQSWRLDGFNMADITVCVVIFLIIAIVSWLSNREIERSLIRARMSEAELKRERDSLEIKVEEKTRELKEAQAEKMAQLYRFAEFGRLSSGLFHDLINPLSAVSLSMQEVKDVATKEAKTNVERAVLAAKKMEDLVITVRKQLAREENYALFSIDDEVKQVVNIMSHKSQSAGVPVSFASKEEIYVYGDGTKFHYAVLNLLANAIDAYKGMNVEEGVSINLNKKGDQAVLKIADHGSGIEAEHLSKIFEPFFTTKAKHEGTGVGLSTTKRIIEKDFSGIVEVASKTGKGTTFKIKIPIRTLPLS